MVQSKARKWRMHHSVITSSKCFQMSVALVALRKLKEGLGPLFAWILCNSKSLCPANPLSRDWTSIWGLGKGQPNTSQDSPNQQGQNQPLSWEKLSYTTGTCEKVLKLNPWDFCSSALEKHLCWKAPHLIAGETWSEQKGDSQPLAKLLALLSGFYQPCASHKVLFRCIFPERLNASVQITVLGINCPLRQNNWSLRPCAQNANHV